MMRSKPAASSLQKTYDECYLLCSTAVYFEGQNNEEEALRSWRSALEVIYYHNAYRVPSNYVPKTETERALQESIRQLEAQCRERVDLLEALRESRKEAQDRDAESNGSKKDAARKGKSSSAKPVPSQPSTPGWIGDGTIPAVDYDDLSKPPTLRRPAPLSKRSSESVGNPDEMGGSFSGRGRSRGSSPDKRKPMLTTLRNNNAKKSEHPKRKETRPAASKAAGLAWGALYSSSSTEKAASDAALVSSRRRLSNEAGAPKESERRSRSSDEKRNSPEKHEKSHDPISTRHRRESQTPTQPLRRSPKRITVSSISPRRHSDTHDQLSYFPTADPAVASSSFPSRPDIKPKPLALRTAPQPHATSSGPGQITLPAPASSRVDNVPTTTTVGRRTPEQQPSAKTIGSSSSSRKSGVSANHEINARPVTKVTLQSSDQESLDRTSTDDGENEDIMSIMHRLPKGVDPNGARQILNDIIVRGDEVHWDDIAGLEVAKKALKEAVVYPFLRPDLFSGLREPARGMLLFGPPGTGKTMLARAVATESKSTFFSVSASTLMSKWHGESEKLVRALFALAKAMAPSIIFVDEIDSLLSSRSSSTEHEASRRSKTEFLIQWSDLQRAAAGREQSAKERKDGDPSRVLVLAATNLPWDIDEAARRRFVRRQYIPLPDPEVREQQLRRLLSHQKHDLSDEDIDVIVRVTEGFSGSDLTALAKDAAMGPLRNLGEALLHTPKDQIRPIRFQDFEASLHSIRPSVGKVGLKAYEDWAMQFGERGG